MCTKRIKIASLGPEDTYWACESKREGGNSNEHARLLPVTRPQRHGLLQRRGYAMAMAGRDP